MGEYNFPEMSGSDNLIKTEKGEQLSKCPYCGGSEFYRKGYVSGQYVYRYRFDGETTYNGELHDSITYKENKTCFCSNCNKSLGALIK